MADHKNNNFPTDINDAVKKVLLAGIGGAALTAEKAQSILDAMVNKGELTVEQGKALNQELKHTVKENLDKKEEEKAAKEEAKADADEDSEEKKPDVEAFVKGLSDEEKEKLRELLNK